MATLNAQVADAKAKNADYTAKSIDVANVARAALLNQMQIQANNGVASAKQQQTADGALASRPSPRVTSVNPPPPQGFWQTVNDYIPAAQLVDDSDDGRLGGRRAWRWG